MARRYFVDETGVLVETDSDKMAEVIKKTGSQEVSKHEYDKKLKAKTKVSGRNK